MRYERQEKIIGSEAQQLLSAASVAILGVGALGSVSAELLARAGVKELILIDRDLVEETNLQRQGLYGEADIEHPKVLALEKHLKNIRSDLIVTTKFIDLTHENISELGKPWLIVDGTDNLQTRFLLNEYCKVHETPWVYGSAIGQEGYVRLMDDDVCFGCFSQPASLGTCESVGVLGSITHTIASLQVQLALDYVRGISRPDLYHVSLKDMKIDKIAVKQKESCSCCNADYPYLAGEGAKAVKLCGSSTYQFQMGYDYNEMKIRVFGKDLGYALKVDNMLILKDGRVLIKAESEQDARSQLAKVVGH